MPKDTNRRWWTEPKGQRGDSLVATEKLLRAETGPWHQKFLRLERLYTGVRVDTQIGTGRALALAVGASKKLPAVSYNIVKSIIDTKRAKITSTDIRPFAITDGGDWKKKRRAKKLTKYSDGLFYEAEMRTKAPEVYRRARITGTSAMKVFEKNKKPAVEITDIVELRIDPEDAKYGKPRQMMQVKQIHRDVLRELFPKPVTPKAVSGAKRLESRKGEVTIADMVEVFEGWHLPSGPDADDGLHILATTAGTLFEEPWTEDDFPFVFMRAEERLFGFWGVGDAEDLEGLQAQLDKLTKTIQLSNHLCSVPGYYVRNGSNVPTGAINNEIGRVVRGDDPNPPIPLEAPNVPNGLLQEQSDIIQRAFQTKGVSEAAAASQVPAGITGSGEAQRVYADTQTERFNVEAKEYEQFHIRLARKLINLARTIHERDGKFAVRVPGRKFLETIDWSQVSLENDEFDMQVQPTSMMPKTISGRIATVEDLLHGGFIDNPKTEGRRMLDLPDIESDTDLALAAYDYAESEIDRLLDGKKLRAIVPYADYALCVDLGRKHWLASYIGGAPEGILATLDQWITEAGAKMKQAMAANAPPSPAPAPGGPAGMGQPTPPPTTNLLPANAPAAA